MRTPFLPILAVLFLWGVWPLLAKVSVGRLGNQALWWSYWAGLAVVGLYLLWSGEPMLPKDRLGLVASLGSGTAVAVGSLFFYELLRRQPASVVAFLTGLYPVISLVLGWLLLQERPTPGQMAGIVLAATAIVLLTR